MSGVYDSLVGIDLTGDAVYTYGMDIPFPALCECLSGMLVSE